MTETQRTGRYRDAEGTKRKKKGKKNVEELLVAEWHTLSPEDTCTRLGVSPVVGLDSAMAARRLAKDGRNILTPPPKNLPKKYGLLFGHLQRVY